MMTVSGTVEDGVNEPAWVVRGRNPGYELMKWLSGEKAL